MDEYFLILLSLIDYNIEQKYPKKKTSFINSFFSLFFPIGLEKKKLFFLCEFLFSCSSFDYW